VSVGPLFYYELVRLARKGRSTVLRCAYALALLAALFLAYRECFPRFRPSDSPFALSVEVHTRRLAFLAQSFVVDILWVQTLAVYLLTPAYVAGAIAGEKERGTLDLLLTTRLRDREIVFGKLAARLTHLGAVLLAGLPLMALTQLWGGVDVRLLAAAFALTGLNLLGVGSLSIFFSVSARTVAGATAASYGFSALLLLVCLAAVGGTPAMLFALANTLGHRLWHDDTFIAILIAVACHTAVTLIFGTRAVFRLRPRASVHFDGLSGGPAASNPGQWRATSPVGDHPLLWKEAYLRAPDWRAHVLGLGRRRRWPKYLLVAALYAGPARAVGYVTGQTEAWLWLFNLLTRVELVCGAGVWCAVTAFLASGSIGLERDKRTLDGLLTLPAGGGAILLAKGFGSVIRGRLAGQCLGFLGLAGLLGGFLHPAALPLAAAAVVVQLCFWASLGLWLSVTCRTTFRARVATTAAWLLVFAGILFYWQLDYLFFRDPLKYFVPTRPDAVTAAVWEIGANPVGTWWVLAFGWGSKTLDDVEPWRFAMRLTVAAGGTLVFLFAAVVLWLDAWRRLRKG
jgi:ABC-type transport system involved in multi-copper enzyme maturation permease subunit